MFSVGEQLTGGSLRTLEFAIKHRKPHLHLSAAFKDNAASELKKWMQENNIRVLNVHGLPKSLPLQRFLLAGRHSQHRGHGLQRLD